MVGYIYYKSQYKIKATPDLLMRGLEDYNMGCFGCQGNEKAQQSWTVPLGE